MKRILTILLLSFAASVCAQPPWNNVLSTSRGYRWDQNAGIQGGGGIPAFTQCGATITPYGTSGTYASPSTIINALNHTGAGYTGCGANTYILLGNGDFYLNAGIHNSGLSNVELRGGGPQNTRLHFNGTAGGIGGFGSVLIDFSSGDGTYAGGSPTAYNCTAPSQGATTLTCASSLNIVIGTMGILDQYDTNCAGGCPNVYTPGTTFNNCSEPADNGNFFSCQAKMIPAGAICSETCSGSSCTTTGTASVALGCSENGPNNFGARPNRGQQEQFIVTACSPSCNNSGSTVLTLSHPVIYPNWTSGLSPQIWYIQPSDHVGVQGFSIDASFFTGSGGAHPLTTMLGFDNVSNFWEKNVILSNAPNITNFFIQSTNGDIESNYWPFPGQDNPSNDSSAITGGFPNTLIVNNICVTGKVCILPAGPFSGSVIAYNYFSNANTGNGYMFGDLWLNHSNGADFNLYEGNVASQLLWDQTHGTALMITAFRNFLTAWESCANGNCTGNTPPMKVNQMDATEMGAYAARYANYLANIEGTPGITTLGYQRTNQSGYQWFNGSGLGYAENVGSGNNAISNAIPPDPVVGSTSMFWGNWDAYHGATQWNTGAVPSGISVYPNSVPTACVSGGSCPASFVFSSPPLWWNVPQWPAIGPDVSGGNVGQVQGTLNNPGHQSGTPAIIGATYAGDTTVSAWGGHVNAIPAMAYYLSLGGLPDGTGGIVAFDGSTYYSATGVSLTVSTTGSGTGTISGTNCATGSYTSATAIGPCTATPTGGSTFTGWSSTGSASCSGTGTCPASGSFSLTATTTITATFAGATPAGTPVATPSSGTWPYNTTVNFTSSSGCAGHFYFSTVNNPPTIADNNANSLQITHAAAAVYIKIIGCPGFADSAVDTAGPYAVGNSNPVVQGVTLYGVSAY
jgi:Divergent InlB B-repeat domain